MPIIEDPKDIQIQALVREVPDPREGAEPGSTVLYEFESLDALNEYSKQMHNKQTHKAFFEKQQEELRAKMAAYGASLAQETPAEARQSQRRAAAIKELAADFVRVEPGTGIAAEYVDFNYWSALSKAYVKARDEGLTRAQALKEVGFEPASVYTRQLYEKADGTRRDKPIRQLFVHEVGIRPNGTIVLLKDVDPGGIGTVVVTGADIGERAPLPVAPILGPDGAPLTPSAVKP